jgi:hypothetical protein
VSTADINRNKIVKDFLEKDSDWLFWMDADNSMLIGSIPRLLATATDGKTAVSGLYFGGSMDRPFPIAYARKDTGAYVPFSDIMPRWERGEIFQIDAVGMGCCLTHRSVYEDIQANMVVLQRDFGGITAVQKSKVYSYADGKRHPYAGEVRKGVYYDPVSEVTMTDPRFPFFACQYNRTEDFWFWELAAMAGHKLWLDTSVEAGHIKPYRYGGKDFRMAAGMWVDPEVQEVEYAI